MNCPTYAPCRWYKVAYGRSQCCRLSFAIFKIIHNASIIKVDGHIVLRDNIFKEIQYITEHCQSGIDGQLHKSTVRSRVHSSHAITSGPLEHHSKSTANIFGFNQFNQVLMLQFAIYRQSCSKSGNGICGITVILFGRSTCEFDEITLTVLFCSEADVSGILVIINFEYRST